MEPTNLLGLSFLIGFFMSTRRVVLTSLASCALAVFATGAIAAASNPATTSFPVTATVVKACTVAMNSAAGIAFGEFETNSTASAAQTTTINVTCSKKTGYTIALTPSNASTSGAGVMTLGGMDFASASADQKIAYQLQQPTGSGVWGNVTGTGPNVYTGTGNGAVQPIIVNGSVAAGAWNVEPGAYSDTVQVKVTY
ncbi:Csu type fimbrial protein [Diaphorobacter caeni]|uniref:Csu type fimbrial protein n=1 Tax=Diaphorobacter caeni TaxID=2784387 RepID=UPI00188EBC00|nr:spore coat protein U domain-containing protein [Diaphorobacter caeni]MBF5002813.1 spore coat protein U domain-containing protein [Diaphorobacter caeni]